MGWELTALCGIVLATYGLYGVYPPSAWIALGVVLTWIGIRGHRRSQS